MHIKIEHSPEPWRIKVDEDSSFRKAGILSGKGSNELWILDEYTLNTVRGKPIAHAKEDLTLLSVAPEMYWLTRTIANFTKYKEGGDIDLDDALETLNRLISEARKITNKIERRMKI